MLITTPYTAYYYEQAPEAFQEEFYQTIRSIAGHIIVCYLLAYGIAKPAVGSVMAGAGYSQALSGKIGMEAKAILPIV